MGILYRLDFVGGKSYIGISIRSARQRFSDHRQTSRKNAAAVYCAWRKHGEPTIVVLAEIGDLADLRDAEREAIVIYGTFVPNGYNMTHGGDTNPMDVPELAEAAAKKNRGRKHTEEARRNMGLSRKGRKATTEHRANISAGQTGRVHSAETREKIRNRAVGRVATDETRAAMSAQRKGKPTYERTDEQRRRLSEFRKEYWSRMRKENPDALRAAATKQGVALARSWAVRKANAGA